MAQIGLIATEKQKGRPKAAQVPEINFRSRSPARAGCRHISGMDRETAEMLSRSTELCERSAQLQNRIAELVRRGARLRGHAENMQVVWNADWDELNAAVKHQARDVS